MAAPRTRAGRAHRAVFGIALSLVLAFVAVSAAAAATHTQVLPVLSGSMEPTIGVNALIVARPVTAAEVHLGDVVVFAHPHDPAMLVMHRVIELGTADGVPVMRTRGDANAAAAPWTLNLSQSVLHRVDLAVPHAGQLYRAVHATAGTSTSALVWPGLLLLAAAFAVGVRRRARQRSCPNPRAAGPGPEHSADDLAGPVPAPATVEELRHRLAAIVGYSEVLTENDPARAAADVRMASTVHEHARRLTDTLDELQLLGQPAPRLATAAA